MVSDETKKPPPFFCPSCGQKHRAVIDELLQNPTAVMRATCTRCGLGLSVSLRDDGTLDCALAEEVEDAEVDDASVEGPKDEDVDVPEDVDDGTGEARLAAADDEAEFGGGDHVGRYQIEKRIGFGGTSSVYRAFDPTTNRNVALKVLNKGSTETMHQRFLREIEVQANIRHPNIMPVFDRGTLEDDRPYFTMELLYKPFTLLDVVTRREAGTLTRYKTLEGFTELPELIAKVVVPVADGIYVANIENGVVHRDLKPGNVLVDSRTLRPYVIDFGICHVLDRAPSLDKSTVVAPTADEAGIVGTPRFLAPEQVKGNAHARTDVWGLGALIHFVITGEPPIAGASNISRSELKRRIKALEDAKASAEKKGRDEKAKLCAEKLARLRDESLRTFDDIFKDARDAKYSPLPATVPAALAAVVKKAMSKSPSDRYVNARQLTSEVQAWLSGSRVRALTEAGGRHAAADSAKRAVKHHTLTGLWVALGLLAGLGLGFLLAKPGHAGPSTRLADAGEDIERLAKFLPKLKRMTDDERLAVGEQVHLWRALEQRAQSIEDRLRDEPATGNVQAVRQRLQFVRKQFAAPRFVLDVPAGVDLSAETIVPEGADPVSVTAGENQLPPGKYLLDVGKGAAQLPIVVPLRVRDAQHDADREPAFAVFKLPLPPEEIPLDMRLVPGATVRSRDLPFHDPTPPENVPAFLMGLTEVTNANYQAFLQALPEKERGDRTPAAGFGPGARASAGRENEPVVGIRAEDALAYAAWKSEQDGVR